MKIILHIISGLDSGGAEKILLDLVTNDVSNNHYIISFKDKGIYKREIIEKKINVKSLKINKYNFLFKIIILGIHIFKLKPNIVLTWMYHADFLGGLIAKILLVPKVFWNIRNSTLDKNAKLKTKMIIKLCSKFSYIIPNKIVSCSEQAINIHKKLNYKNDFYLINNGVNINKFKRLELKKEQNILNLGFAGRWHSQKNYPFFFESLSNLKNHHKFEKFKVLMAGNKINKDNTVLVNLIREHKLLENIVLLNEIKDMPKFYNSIDVNVLTSSYGEAFPNVLIEAMSCEVPCLSTEIGDSRKIIGDTGWVIKQNDKEMFCDAVLKIFEMKSNFLEKWEKVRSNCRLRVVSNFSQDKMIKNYNKLFLN